ncbi:MAG: TonB-dependent receptor [Novosphingobium sp.]
MNSASLTTLVLALALPLPALAQTSADSDYHAEEDQEIVVTGAIRVSRRDVLSGVAVVAGQDLQEAVRPSLGETLAGTPGVSASSFGPGSSRPVLRGLQGDRVSILSNGLGAIDASNTSVDHAPAINPLLAQRIEVLRGPQALQYGSAAIGGVVNVIDRRIPYSVPDEPVHFSAMGGYGSAADERSLAASADLAIGGGWVFHADGSWLKANDLRIPGFALTQALRDEALATSLLPEDQQGHSGHEDIDYAANAAVQGRLPNSAARTWTASAGLAYIDEGGSIGFSYSRLDNRYGVPVRLATLPGQGQEAPIIQLRQDRIDARAELNLGEGLFDKFRFRYAYADYRHDELVDGAIEGTFLNKGMEGRLELVQNERSGWSGASGMQFVIRDFDVISEESYLPRNKTEQLGVFTVQQLQKGPLRLEAGLRFERTRQKSSPIEGLTQFYSGSRDFDAFSASLGVAVDVAPGWKVGANLSQAERAPAAEELFASGPHHGTETYEIGDPFLKIERARSVEGIVRGSGNGFDIEFTAFHSWFDNFIYASATGDIEDGLPVFTITQADARLYGFEFQAGFDLAKVGPWTFRAEGMADYVRATIDGEGPAPRIPPLRLKGGLRAESPHLDFGAEVEHVTAQNRVAQLETTTPAYTLVNLAIAWRPWGAFRPVSITLSANNLFDVEARRHASFLKDYAPLPGRDIRAGMRIEF